jgi:hypothetical protein
MRRRTQSDCSQTPTCPTCSGTHSVHSTTAVFAFTSAGRVATVVACSVVHHALSAIGVLAGRGAVIEVVVVVAVLVEVEVEAVSVMATFFRRVT